MTELARDHDNLAAVMAFMRDKIGQHMRDVEGKIPPRIGSGGGKRATAFKTELQQTDNAATTAIKGSNQLLWFNLPPVNGGRHRHAVFFPQCLDPHTSHI